MPLEALRYYYHYTARLGPEYFGDWDFRSTLGKLTGPALVIYGARDTLRIPGQRAWVAARPNARLWLVPEAGKSALADQPDLVFSAIEDFLKGRWPSGSASR